MNVSPLNQCRPIVSKQPTREGIVQISTEIPFWCAYRQVFPKQEEDRISSELKITFNSMNHELESLAENTEAILQPYAIGTSSLSEEIYLALVESFNEAYIQWIKKSGLFL